MKYPLVSYTYAQFLPGAKNTFFSIIISIVTDNFGIGKESEVTGFFAMEKGKALDLHIRISSQTWKRGLCHFNV